MIARVIFRSSPDTGAPEAIAFTADSPPRMIAPINSLAEGRTFGGALNIAHRVATSCPWKAFTARAASRKSFAMPG